MEGRGNQARSIEGGDRGKEEVIELRGSVQQAIRPKPVVFPRVTPLPLICPSNSIYYFSLCLSVLLLLFSMSDSLR